MSYHTKVRKNGHQVSTVIGLDGSQYAGQFKNAGIPGTGGFSGTMTAVNGRMYVNVADQSGNPSGSSSRLGSFSRLDIHGY